MKRNILVLAAIIIGLSLYGCVDFNSGRRPIDQENTKWVSTDPDIFFEVNERFRNITGSRTYGEINIDGVITEIFVSFDFGTNITFYPISAFNGEFTHGDEWLFIGRCRFRNDRLVVNIFNNSRGFLDDSINTIVFYREKIEQ